MIKKGRQPKSLKEHMPHCFLVGLLFWIISITEDLAQATNVQVKGRRVCEQYPPPPHKIEYEGRGGKIAKHIKLSCGLLETWDPR